MLNRNKIMTITAIVMTVFLTEKFSQARDGFFIQTSNKQEIDRQLNLSVDLLAKTTRWKESAFFVLITEVETITAGIGGSFGEGILVARNSGQTWGNPVFIRVASGKIEMPNNTKPSALMFVFNDQAQLNAILKNGSFPSALAQVYAHNNQHFTPVSLSGLVNIETNPTSNANFYGQRANVAEIINGRVTTYSEALIPLIAVLNR